MVIEEVFNPSKEVGDTVSTDPYIRTTGEKWRRLHSSPTKSSEVWWQHGDARPHAAVQTTSYLGDATLPSYINHLTVQILISAMLFSLYLKRRREIKESRNQESKKSRNQIILDFVLHFLCSIPTKKFINKIH